MMSDKDLILCEMLVLRCQRRDARRAAEELVAAFEKPLLYYLRRLVGSENDAWDLLQETWMSASPRDIQRSGRPRPARLPLPHRPQQGVGPAAPARRRPSAERRGGRAGQQRFRTQFYLRGRRCCPRGARQAFAGASRGPDSLFSSRPEHSGGCLRCWEFRRGDVKSRLHHAKKALGTVLREGVNHVR